MGDTLLDRLSTYPALRRMRAGPLAMFEPEAPDGQDIFLAWLHGE